MVSDNSIHPNIYLRPENAKERYFLFFHQHGFSLLVLVISLIFYTDVFIFYQNNPAPTEFDWETYNYKNNNHMEDPLNVHFIWMLNRTMIFSLLLKLGFLLHSITSVITIGKFRKSGNDRLRGSMPENPVRIAKKFFNRATWPMFRAVILIQIITLLNCIAFSHYYWTMLTHPYYSLFVSWGKGSANLILLLALMLVWMKSAVDENFGKQIPASWTFLVLPLYCVWSTLSGVVYIVTYNSDYLPAMIASYVITLPIALSILFVSFRYFRKSIPSIVATLSAEEQTTDGGEPLDQSP